jgi:hypothetical protein
VHEAKHANARFCNVVDVFLPSNSANKLINSRMQRRSAAPSNASTFIETQRYWVIRASDTVEACCFDKNKVEIGFRKMTLIVVDGTAHFFTGDMHDHYESAAGNPACCSAPKDA